MDKSRPRYHTRTAGAHRGKPSVTKSTLRVVARRFELSAQLPGAAARLPHSKQLTTDAVRNPA